ncbi:hypothetical protein NDU88_004213 [Pleurodeles waltl]|uniref:Uncharacterized protein n=1 Tax=Pleurodeles waltl TaxID=8319 RepID=A0AAV7MSU4_PLEWA|nr:hypothetical protein NDU88_004213 [Pleurodeles waltl]
MAREHGYNSGSQKKAGSDPVSSSSEQSSEQGDDPPRKRKKKVHHQEAPTPKLLTFEPEDIVHPRSSLWLPPPEVADYVESHIRHSFDKEVRSRLSLSEAVQCGETSPNPKFVGVPQLARAVSHSRGYRSGELIKESFIAQKQKKATTLADLK